MRKALLVAVLVLGLVAPVFAQSAAPAGVEQPKTIVDFQKELGLTDKQAGDIKKLLSDLQVMMAAKVQEVTNLRQQLVDLINKKGDMKQIRQIFEKMAAIQVDVSCRDIEVSRQVDSVLTADQIAKWKDIQQKSRNALVAGTPEPAPAPKK